MLSNQPPPRIYTIRQRAGDRHFVSRSDRPGEAPLAIDPSLATATAVARHAANVAAAQMGCRVLIMLENSQGYLERVGAVEP